MLERGALAAMGTRFEIIVAGEPGSHARAAIEMALKEIEHCHRLWNPFSGDSVVARLNAADRSEVPIDGLTQELLTLCQRFQRETEGAFSATTGALLASRDPRRESTCHEGLTSESAFEVLQQPPRIRLNTAGLRWDFGAIAKGFALDLAVEALREAGIGNAFLHGGASSVAVMGQAPGLSSWRVQLPDGEILELEDGDCLAVSSGQGVYEGDHLVDPVSGDWIENLSLGCWVRGSMAAAVDAWATALLVSRQRSDLLPEWGIEGVDWAFFELDAIQHADSDGIAGEERALPDLGPLLSGEEPALI